MYILRLCRGLLAHCARHFGVLTLSSLLAVTASAATQSLNGITIGLQTYNSVVVQSRTATHLFFQHDRGFAAIKIKDVSVPVQQKLGLIATPPPGSPDQLGTGNNKNQVAAQVIHQAMVVSEPYQKKFKDDILPVLIRAFWLVLAITVIAYFIVCFCLLQICLKAGEKPGVLIWIPLLHSIPLFKAAKMSPGNVILLLIPVVNLVVSLVWCVKICQALQKPAWMGFFLWLPPITLLMLFYLALADSADPEADAPVKLDFAESITTD